MKSNDIVKELLSKKFNIHNTNEVEYSMPENLRKSDIDFFHVRGNLRLQMHEVLTDEDIDLMRKNVLSKLK